MLFRSVVESNDAMQFNVKSIDVPKSCKKFSVTLKHVGKMPKTSMGHNMVVTTTADVAAAAADGMKAGAAADYVKAGDTRVLAHSKVIGGGESTTFDIDVAKLKEARPYVIVGAFVIAAVVTPPDVVSQLMLAVPMCLLYELGIFLSRFVTKTRADEAVSS